MHLTAIFTEQSLHIGPSALPQLDDFMIGRIRQRRLQSHRDGPAADDVDRKVNLERVGRTRIEDIVASTRKVPWVLTLLQLLWTAGPVTFLAMQGGSYLGYGEPVSVDTYFFFAFYVVLAALIGIVARIVADVMRGKKQSQARANVTRTLDIAPDLIFTVRDLHLSTLPPDQRQQQSAAILLAKLDVGPASVAMAVEDITHDRELADAAHRIEIYRRAGMFTRVEDWAGQIAPQRQAALRALGDESSSAVEAVDRRLQGFAPSQEAGVSRGRNFISQVFAAAQHDDLAMMTLANVEDLLLLVFELMSDRQITRLTIDYEGNWELARALDEVERTQNDYRQVKATANLCLYDLTSLLTENGVWNIEVDTLNVDAGQRLEQTRAALTTLVNERPTSGKPVLSGPSLKQAFRYARLIRQALDRLHDRHRRKVRALKHWERMREKDRLQKANKKNAKNGKQGLRIKESTIGLTDEQKLHLAASFCRYLDEKQVRPGSHGVMRRENVLGVDDAKRLGIHLSLALEELIDLDQPSIQRAIESSNGIFLQGLETGFSADAKAGIGAAAVKEVQENLGPAAELIALRLTTLYRLPLSPSVIDFLSDTYGGDRQRLEYLAASAEHAEQIGELTKSTGLSLAEAYSGWRDSIQAIERLLARLARQ